MPYRQNTGWTEYLIGSLVVPVESVKLYTLGQIVYGSGQMANYLSFLRSSWVASHQHGTHGKDCGWRPRFWKTYSSFTYAIACLHLQTVLQRPSYLGSIKTGGSLDRSRHAGARRAYPWPT